MENPYARTAAPAAATPAERLLADYELAIGRNVSYFLPKFERYDAGGSTASWNWPAFFVTSGWYLYRKMYLWGLLNLFFPIIATIVIGIGAAVLRVPPLVTGLLLIVALIGEWLLATVFANALYWRHVNKVIADVPRSIADKPDRRMRRVERDGGTSVGVMIAILSGLGIFYVGIVAGITIPAYRDFTIRSQMKEGLVLAERAKSAVGRYYAQKGEWPLDAESAGLPRISGEFVDSVTVANGSVVVTFTGIETTDNYRLMFVPGLNEHGDVIWTCGDHEIPPQVVAPGPGPQGSNVPAKYLPPQCRPAAGT